MIMQPAVCIMRLPRSSAAADDDDIIEERDAAVEVWV